MSTFDQVTSSSTTALRRRSVRTLVAALSAFAMLLTLVPAGAIAAPEPFESAGDADGITVQGEVAPAASTACPSGIPVSPFTDRGDAHGRAIDCLVAYGITQGTSPTTFGTNDALSRRQMTLFLARTMAQLPGFTFPSQAEGLFPDVGQNAFTSAIETLANFDPPIVQGFADGTFRPLNPLTRAQLASFLGRTHEEIVRQFPDVAELPTATETGFPDISIDQTHGNFVAQLAAAGVIGGFTDGTFGPTRTVTRGQFATFVTRQLDLYAQAGILRQLPGLDPEPPVEPSGVDIRGSIEQVIVAGADPNTPVTLIDPSGQPVASDSLPWSIGGQAFVAGGDTTDASGSIVFRGTLDDTLAYSGIPAGSGYTVRYVEDGQTRTSEPITVLSATDSTPPQSFYDAQTLRHGFGYIETRDGTLLSVMVRLPGPADQGPYPVMVEYSGYSPSQPYDNPLDSNGTTTAIGELLGYATVAVNIRGSGCSGGAFDYFETIQGLDGYDVIETVAAQPWSGNIATTGVSYPGISQLFLAATQPPSLTAAAPVAIISDHARDTVYPGGIYNTGFAREWAEEREEDTRFPGGQGWVDRAVAGNDPLMTPEDAATCGQNVRLRGQNMPLLDRIQTNEFETPLWADRAPFDFAEDITTNLYIAVSSQDEQTGGRASAILDALDLDRDDRIVRFTGTNGTHVEALGPELLSALIEFLELYVAERTPVLTERPDWNQLAFALSLVYSETLGAGVPSGPQLAQLFPQDRFAGLSYEEALAAFESEPPAQILYENGAGGGPAGFPLPSFTKRYEFDELPNLDDGFDADANSWYLQPDGTMGTQPPTVEDGATGDHSSYVYDPSLYPPYSFGDTRPSNSAVWFLQPAYNWAQPPEGAHLSFVTPPLAEDTLTFGSASVDLWLDSDLDDTDLEVMISEIRPDGQEMYVTTGWLRASKRELDELSTALRPRPTFRAEDAAPLAEGWNEVRVETFPFGHAFREGSRVRLTIEAPGGNRPTWRFDDTVDGGPDVENRIAHSVQFASKLVLPVIASDTDVPTGLPGCADSTTPEGFTAVRGQPCRTAPDVEPDPVDTGPLVIGGSVEQVYVMGADPGTPITLLDPQGQPVANDALPWSVSATSFSPGGDTTDAKGSMVFRGTLDDTLGFSGIPAGGGYTVEYVKDGETQVSDPIEVLTRDFVPDQAFYDDQVLEPGLTYITTRDGTKLSAYVTLPPGGAAGGPYPTLIEYSGYDVSAPAAPGALPVNIQAPTLAIGQLLGYATVAVNIRGTGCSGGAFDYFELLQALDGYDAVEVVAAQPWSANVGTTGVSYPGISQLFLTSTQPPSLSAAAPVAVISDHARDTVYPGGIFNTGFAFEWAEERERDTRQPGGQGWVDQIINTDNQGAATCRENVRLRDQNLPLLDRILANQDRNPLWDTRSPYDFAEDITTNLFIVNSWQDEQTGGRAAALIDALDLDRDDRIVRFTGTNGTHVEALGPDILTDLIEFLELYVAERTPALTSRPDFGAIRFLMPLLYTEILGPGVPQNPADIPIPADRFTGLSYADTLEAYETEPPAKILFETGAGDGPDGFPFPRFSERFEWDELPNLDEDFDVDGATWYLDRRAKLSTDAPTADDDGTAAAQTSYTYDPDAYPPYSFAARPGNSQIWFLQPAYRWLQPPVGKHAGFLSDPVEDDVVLVGSASVDLWLDTNNVERDTDLEVVLSEVRPDGTEMYLTAGWLRASRRVLDEESTALRPRPSFRAEDTALLEDGWNEVRVETFPFSHVVREGSQIRLTIEAPGGNRPIWRFDDTVPGGDGVVNIIGHNAAAASKLVLPVVTAEVGPIPAGPAACAPSDAPGGFTSVRGQPCRTAPEPFVEACDGIDGAACMLPFPNDHFTATDASTPTGLRVDLPAEGTPLNTGLALPFAPPMAPTRVDPTEWNRNDGFSPGSMALTYVDGLDLQETFGLPEGVEVLDRPNLTLAEDAPIVLIDLDTGERWPYYAEVDAHPDAVAAGERVLIIRPLVNLTPGHRYAVALRGLRDGAGDPIEAGEVFAYYRDGDGPEPLEADPVRAGEVDALLEELQDLGIERDELYLAWDFTVASSENLTGRALSIRDQAFAELGDTDLADRVVAGDAPAVTITNVTEPGGATARRVEGRVRVPNFLHLQPTDTAPALQDDGTWTLESVLATQARFAYDSEDPGPMDLPIRNTTADLSVPFSCNIPTTATAEDPSTPLLYGHGLMGRFTEVNGGSTARLRERNFTVCAVDWAGMSTLDAASVSNILQDASRFRRLADRLQQGHLNAMFLGRALIHPDGLSTISEFQDEDGAALISLDTLGYDGNSQGGILGGALIALSPDIERGVLGVPGVNYSTLLNRSVDWEGAIYGGAYYQSYADPVERQLGYALLQMLWDRGEGNGYTHATTSDPLPNTPSHDVLLHVAWADYQVANVASEVQARSYGARLLQTSLDASRHWSDDFEFGFETFDVVDGVVQPYAGSAIVYFDSGNGPFPSVNLPPANVPGEGDPHSDPRADQLGGDQRAIFLTDGLVTDPFEGQPYWTQVCRGAANPNCP